MTSVHNASTHSFPRPVRPFAPPSNMPRKNSMMSVTASPVLSSFAIDLIAQFDNYRVNMRESLQREVEENIHKAKVLKEAMKESSDRDAEILISEEEQEYNKNRGSTPDNRSNTSLDKGQNQQGLQQQNGGDANLRQKGKSSGANSPAQEKRSRLDRIFGRKASVNSHAPSSLRNHQVTPHPQPQSQLQSQSQSQAHSQHTPSPSLLPSNTLIQPQTNGSAVDVTALNYLPVDEEPEEEILARSMAVAGADVDGSSGELTGTEVKLHPTRAKTFALPKSLRNLKRRIAALRAKGTDLDAEKREKEERERAANGGVGATEDKKKFTFIRLLPWRSAKKPAEMTANPMDATLA